MTELIESAVQPRHSGYESIRHVCSYKIGTDEKRCNKSGIHWWRGYHFIVKRAYPVSLHF